MLRIMMGETLLNPVLITFLEVLREYIFFIFSCGVIIYIEANYLLRFLLFY
jgi:hypothetical protein